MTKEVILTGIRSNEEPTIANYLGAFLPMVEMQKKYAGQYQINMFVPDLHSFTTPTDHAKLYDNTLHNLKYFIAAGLDIKNPDTFVYRQSYIPAHSELTWILDCFTYMGEMGRMIQYKEKSQDVRMTQDDNVRITEDGERRVSTKNENNNVSVGLFNYPVLMAADILLYGARWVPVGEDQFQHLEIARDIATRMNNKFGELFIVPEPTAKQTEFMQRDKGLRIRSLTDPTKKMSKSSTDEKSKISLSDTPQAAAKKIMSATTDSNGTVNYDWDAQPGIASLLQMLALLTQRDQAHVNAEWEGTQSYGDLKRAVADAVSTFLTDFHARFDAIDDNELLTQLEINETAMRSSANETLQRVQQAVGLRPRK